MVWYDPKNIKQRRKIPVRNIREDTDESPIVVPELEEAQVDVQMPTISKPSGSLLLDVNNAIKLRRTEQDIANREVNLQNASVNKDFSLDPYTVDVSTPEEGIIDHTVKTGEDKKSWTFSLTKSILDYTMNNKEKLEDGLSFRESLGMMKDVAQGTYENKWPNLTNDIKVFSVGRQAKKKYGGEFEYIDPELTDFKHTLKYRYNGPNGKDFKKDINDYLYMNDAYNKGLVGTYTFEKFKDEFYNKYKDDFTYTIVDGPGYTVNPYTNWEGMPKNKFFEFVNNEQDKRNFIADEYEKRGVIMEGDESENRVSQGVKSIVDKAGAKVQKSNMSLKARQEFMNDVFADAQQIVGRWDDAMTQVYRTKSWLQEFMNVDDLSKADFSGSPELKDIYTQIVELENTYEKFVDNLGNYISYLPDYVNPETGTLDRIPDSVVDPNTGKVVTFKEVLFDGIYTDDKGYWFVIDSLESPLDILRAGAGDVVFKKQKLTDGILLQLRDYSQYGGAQLGAVISEGGQLVGWLYNKLRNIIVNESGEIPYKFVNMDTSILANLTTNKSATQRLLQSYSVNMQEYVPELAGHIIEAVLVSKGMDKLGTASQIATQARLYKLFPRLKNSLAGRQFVAGYSYQAKVLQLLATDQIIDATASVGDMEPGSKLSRILSLGGTFIGEGIGILSDLRVLGRSFGGYFKPKGTQKYLGMTDPFRLIVDNPGILDNYAAYLGRYSVDESGKIIGDEYKLLLQDLNSYSKYLREMSDVVEKATKGAIESGLATVGDVNEIVKRASYNVLRQVFKQDSAMAKTVTSILTDHRSNIADLVKYIGDIQGTVKIGPFVSTIKLGDAVKTVKGYDEKLDLIIDGGLIRGISRDGGLTKAEVDAIFSQGFLKMNAGEDIAQATERYFTKVGDGYIPNETGLKALGVELSDISNPLVIASMSDDTKAFIERLKTLTKGERALSDADLDTLGEINAIDSLAENIAGIDYLNICK